MQKLQRSMTMFLLLATVLALTAVSGPGDAVLGKAAEKTRTIVDQNGRTVKLPAQVKRVVVTTIWPLPSVFYMVDGSTKRLVGIPPASRSAAGPSMLSVVAPEIMKAETVFATGDDVNLEELMKLRPDVVLFRGENAPEQAKLEKTGIPAVGFRTTSLADGNSIENVYTWMKLLEQVLGKSAKQSKAEEFKRQSLQALNMIQARVKNIPAEKRTRALFLYKDDEKTITVAGSNHFSHFWLTATGAIDVAADIKGTAVVNMEQIYKWDPDIIYITNFTETLPEDLLGNKINGQDWSRVKAVKNHQVYKEPLGIYRWYPPSTDVPLMLKWLAQKNYPGLFNDYSIETEIKTYFKQFYHYQLRDSQVRQILNPPRDAAKDS